MELFYTASFEDNHFTLSEEESNHCINVLRYKVNQPIWVTDGNGTLYEGTIKEAHHKRCKIDVAGKQHQTPLSPYLHIAIAPTKNIERLEWFLEKSTEIGINEITLLLCQHSERRQVRLDRLEKVLVAAMKQSGSFFLPKLNDLTPFPKFVASAMPGIKCIAHCDNGVRHPLHEKTKGQPSSVIMIGPEGDFSPSEIDMALKNNFAPISLGNSRLRTETAGVVACHTVRLVADMGSQNRL